MESRSKRRKLDADGEETTSTCKTSTESRKRKNPILFVPTEIIQAVFRHISYKELSQSVRLVNHRFKLIAEDILDFGFKNIDKQLTTLQRTTELSLAYTQDDMEIKCITKLLNFLEILKMQYAIVLTTIWRYVYNEFYKVPKSSMYGGQLIDAHKVFIWTFLHYPNQLYASAVIRDYYTYFFRNGWFVALPCPSAKEMDWPQRQRMMHMRLRRLVLAHNDMFLQQAQYERELILRPVPNSRIKKPGNNVYTGYGDVGHIFFYYGVMNDGAFAQKFATDEDNDEEENDEEIDVGAAQEVNPANLPQINSDDDIFYRIPYLGLRMTLDVKCPLSYAPQSFLAKMSDIDLKQLKDNPKTSRKVETRIRVIFQCEGASYPRLPTMYDYDFRPVATTAK